MATLSDLRNSREVWIDVENLLSRWLKERQDMLVLYCEVTSLTPFKARKPVSSEIQEFCEIMVDYISAGHFEIFDKLIQEDTAFGGKGLGYLEQLYPQLTKTTELVLQFNDKYDTEAHSEDHLDTLEEDISELGQALADRLDLEDKLISLLHQSHTKEISSLR